MVQTIRSFCLSHLQIYQLTTPHGSTHPVLQATQISFLRLLTFETTKIRRRSIPVGGENEFYFYFYKMSKGQTIDKTGIFKLKYQHVCNQLISQKLNKQPTCIELLFT